MIVDTEDPALDWSCLTIKHDGDVYDGTKKIEYETEAKMAYSYGQGSFPVNVTNGVAGYSASMTMLVASWNRLRDKLCAGGKGWAQAVIEITVQWKYPNEDVQTDVIRTKITKVKKSGEAGSEAAGEVEISLMPKKITENGCEPYARRAA